MRHEIVLDLPDEIRRRIERIAVINETTPAEVVLLALEAACGPDGRKLQTMYALCDQADRIGASPTGADSP